MTEYLETNLLCLTFDHSSYLLLCEIPLALTSTTVHWFLKYHLQQEKYFFLLLLHIQPSCSQNQWVNMRSSECQLSWLTTRTTMKKLGMEVQTLRNGSVAAQLEHTEKQIQRSQLSPCPLSLFIVSSLPLDPPFSICFFSLL